MTADQSGLKCCKSLPGLQHVKYAPGRIDLNVSKTPGGMIIVAIKFDAAPRLCDQILYIFIGIECQ